MEAGEVKVLYQGFRGLPVKSFKVVQPGLLALKGFKGLPVWALNAFQPGLSGSFTWSFRGLQSGALIVFLVRFWEPPGEGGVEWRGGGMRLAVSKSSRSGFSSR